MEDDRRYRPASGNGESCGVCLRDNGNHTHDALQSVGHLNHDYVPASEVRCWNATKRSEYRRDLERRGTSISDSGPLSLTAIAARLQLEDSGPSYDTLTPLPPAVEYDDSPLTFAAFSQANESRCKRWHPGYPTDDSWSLGDWGTALGGETGELLNVLKKIRRIETAHRSKRADEQDRQVLVGMAAGEIGDVLAYLDLVATKLGLSLAKCGANKFNAISEREGYPERIEL